MRVNKTAKIAAIAPAVGLTAMMMTGSVASASPASVPAGSRPAPVASTAPGAPSVQDTSLPNGVTAHRYTGTLDNDGHATFYMNYNPFEYVQRADGDPMSIFDSPRFDNKSQPDVQVVGPDASRGNGVPWEDHFPQLLMTKTKVDVYNRTPFWDKHNVNYDFTIYSGPKDGAWVVLGP